MKEKHITQENKSIYALKAVACFVVIFLHCPLPGVIGSAMTYGLRFSVPSFFLITGYYSHEKKKEWFEKRMKKTLLLIFMAESLSGIIDFIIVLADNPHRVLNWIIQNNVFMKPIKTLIFGCFFNGTLWYLYALFWSFVLICVMEKRVGRKAMYWLVPLLLSGQILGRGLMQMYGDIDLYIYLFRSAFLFGLPFLIMGRFIAEYKTIIARYVKERECIMLFAIGIAMMVCEFVIWHTYMDLHTSTIVITLALFWWACSHPERDYLPILRVIGKRYSMWLYIFHVPCMRIVNYIYANYTSGKTQQFIAWIKPFTAIMLSCAAAFFAERIRNSLGQKS